MSRRIIIWFIVLSGISLAVYIINSALTFRLGFPLDDSWIHQTYARNIIQRGEWAFIPGQVSAGSTAPLWSGLLAIGYILGLGPFIWTYLVGWISLTAMAIIGYQIFQLISPTSNKWAPWVGILFLFEWHLVWAGVSGMETLFFALFPLIVLIWIIAGWGHWFALGAFIGLSVWVRPDGITLLGPAIFYLLLTRHTFKRKINSIFRLSLGFVVVFSLYIVFNYNIAGAWWPNTYYAKQLEYAVELLDPFWWRILEMATLPLVGVGIVLLPGFLYCLYVALKKPNWAVIAGGLWAIGYLLLFAMRLPVTFQHGRYVIPMMPVYFLFGFTGMANWIKPNSAVLLKRVVSRIWMLSAMMVLLMFWIIGCRAFARDVAVIESEMVNTAKWIASNTESDSLIGAHDIGALGYFGDRRILDLAGLISPEVIPFIWDEKKLAEYLTDSGANYLVTFPMWYPHLVDGREPIFITGGKYTKSLGGENMAVYRWNSHPIR